MLLKHCRAIFCNGARQGGIVRTPSCVDNILGFAHQLLVNVKLLVKGSSWNLAPTHIYIRR